MNFTTSVIDQNGAPLAGGSASVNLGPAWQLADGSFQSLSGADIGVIANYSGIQLDVTIVALKAGDIVTIDGATGDQIGRVGNNATTEIHVQFTTASLVVELMGDDGLPFGPPLGFADINQGAMWEPASAGPFSGVVSGDIVGFRAGLQTVGTGVLDLPVIAGDSLLVTDSGVSVDTSRVVGGANPTISVIRAVYPAMTFTVSVVDQNDVPLSLGLVEINLVPAWGPVTGPIRSRSGASIGVLGAFEDQDLQAGTVIFSKGDSVRIRPDENGNLTAEVGPSESGETKLVVEFSTNVPPEITKVLANGEEQPFDFECVAGEQDVTLSVFAMDDQPTELLGYFYFDGDGQSLNTIVAGESFPVTVEGLGAHSFTVVAVDGEGAESLPFEAVVNVVDTTKPTIEGIETVVLDATSLFGARVEDVLAAIAGVTATDACAEDVVPTNNADDVASDGFFPVGPTIVTWTADVMATATWTLLHKRLL
jgi:hypothetical protein